MTKQVENIKIPARDRQAKALPIIGGIQLTAEMVKVGMKKLWEYDPEYSDSAESVIKIFSAMMAAQTSGDQSVFLPEGLMF